MTAFSEAPNNAGQRACSRPQASQQRCGSDCHQIDIHELLWHVILKYCSESDLAVKYVHGGRQHDVVISKSRFLYF